MPLMTKQDDVLWLKHLRAAGIDIGVGETACFCINGAEIHFEPMRPDRNGRPTHGLKAIPFSLPRWNAIPKGAQITIVPCASPSATFDERLGVTPPSAATETAVTAIASWPRKSLTPRSQVPARGSVCGIDVGYSEESETTGFCMLGWDERSVTWQCKTAGTDDEHRRQGFGSLTVTNRRVHAVAVDGPLVPRLAFHADYRSCEAILSQGVLQKRGKPGPTNGGSGPRLHKEATRLAHFALSELDIEPSLHRNPIHDRAIVEAFPNLFLGTLCDEKDYPEQPDNPRGWTDTLYPKLHSQIERLLASLLPGRTVLGDWAVTDHEDIASFTCALTALCVTADLFTAVGSEEDGWILLPPRLCLGSGWESTLINSWVAVLRRFPGARILW